MILKFVVISLLFFVIISQSASVQTNTNQKVINQDTKSNNIQLKDNNSLPKQSQKNNIDNIVFTEVVHPQIKNVTKEIKNIAEFNKQINNESSKATKQDLSEINITFTQVTHPQIKNVTKQVKKIKDFQEQKFQQTQTNQTSNNKKKSLKQQIIKKQESTLQKQKSKTSQIETKISENKQKKQTKDTIDKTSHSEQSTNLLNPNQHQVQEQLYKRDKQFTHGSRFKPNSITNISSSKIKPSQQTFPQKWFDTVKVNKPITHQMRQNLSKFKKTEVPKTTNQKQTPKTQPQQKLKQKISPSLRTNNKQTIVIESNKLKQVQTIPNTQQIVQQQIQTFALYKSVVLIICSVLIFTLVCVKIVNCTFNKQGDENSIKARKDQDKQGLKFSQSELMRDPQDSVGDFIQISEDDENQD